MSFHKKQPQTINHPVLTQRGRYELKENQSQTKSPMTQVKFNIFGQTPLSTANLNKVKVCQLDLYSSKRSPLKVQQSLAISPMMKAKARSNSRDQSPDLPKQQRCQNSMQLTLKGKGNLLTDYEKKEILDYKQVYFLGKDRTLKQEENSFDTKEGEYKCCSGDHIRYQYEILELIGIGSFGQVFKVYDHKFQKYCAIKVIRNEKSLVSQSKVEISLLERVKVEDHKKVSNIIELQDSFRFRKHQCLVFEMLNTNLYELLKERDYQGLEPSFIRKVAIQLLNALHFLKQQQIIHCDIKPENVILQEKDKSGVKLIDFGSGCFVGRQIYTYVQSRFYRAPEIIFGQQYGHEIDIWSFGCVIAELAIGTPLFPANDEDDLVKRISETIGTPSWEFIKNCPKAKKVFREKIFQELEYKEIITMIKDPVLSDFIHKCLQWEPLDRIQPIDALAHPWILEGLPNDMKTVHLKYVEFERSKQNKAFMYNILKGKSSEGELKKQQITKKVKNTRISNLRSLGELNNHFFLATVQKIAITKGNITYIQYQIGMLIGSFYESPTKMSFLSQIDNKPNQNIRKTQNKKPYLF